jgi:hypothetical protein
MVVMQVSAALSLGLKGERPILVHQKRGRATRCWRGLLRGQDEAAVFTRLQALLARKDVQPLPKPAPRKPYNKPYQGQNGADKIRRDFR